MYKAISAFLLVTALAVVSGCASVPMADTAQDTQVKSFAPPAAGKAGVYIYRNETFGAAIRLEVFLDGKKIGETASKTYFYVEVDPGQHEVSGKGENESSMRFNAVAGQQYYFWQEVKMGLLTPRNEVKPVDQATGRAGVLESKLVK